MRTMSSKLDRVGSGDWERIFGPKFVRNRDGALAPLVNSSDGRRLPAHAGHMKAHKVNR